MKLSDIVIADAIVPELEGQTRDQVISELVKALAEAGAITQKSVPEMIRAVLKRENQATTGIGKGVALPHAKVQGVRKPMATIGRSGKGIDFNALDSKPVYSVILLLSDPHKPDEHLQAMETIFKRVQRDMFRKLLRQSQSVDQIVELIEEMDELG